MIRTSELLMRWTELSTFGSAMFRTHIGSSTSSSHSQIYDDDVFDHFAKYARMFTKLSGYRKRLMEEAHSKGWPLMRPMAAHFGNDEKVWKLDMQFMFGDEFLVSPVLDPATNNEISTVNVYFPVNSTWIHLWTGSIYSGGEFGRTETILAPLGELPVFYTIYSETGRMMSEEFGFLKNPKIPEMKLPISETKQCNSTTVQQYLSVLLYFGSSSTASIHVPCRPSILHQPTNLPLPGP